MPSGIELIVAAYVRLKDRRALEDMRDVRRELLVKLTSNTAIDPRQSQELILEDLRVIEKGLEQLQPRPGAIPENELN